MMHMDLLVHEKYAVVLTTVIPLENSDNKKVVKETIKINAVKSFTKELLNSVFEHAHNVNSFLWKPISAPKSKMYINKNIVGVSFIKQ